MAQLPTRQISSASLPAALDPALAVAAVGGDTFTPGSSSQPVFLLVQNPTAGALTITVDSKVPSNYGTDVDLSASVPAGALRLLGPLTERFGDSAGVGNLTYSAAGLNVAVVRL